MPGRELRIGTLRCLEALPAGASPRGTLLLIHAFPMNAHMWEPQLELAASGWRVVAPQLRGFDGGGFEPAVSSMDDYAQDLVGLMDGLGIEQAAIGGVSMGGYASFALFRRAPHRFRAIVLADTRAEADTPQAADGRRRMLELVAKGGAAAVADEMIPKLLGAETRRERPDVADRVRRLVLSSSSAAIAGAIQAMLSRPDSTPLLATFACPALVIVGAEDTVTPPDVARGLHAAISGSVLEVLPGAGHLSNLEQPARFNGALRRFLEQV